MLVVGGGPVGLLLGNLLGAAGIDCLVAEQRPGASRITRAIGIMPPSLEILDRCGLATALIAAGNRVSTAVVHADQGEVLRVSFASLRSRYPFVLTVPQPVTDAILVEGLRAHHTVDHLTGCRVAAIAAEDTGVHLHTATDRRRLTASVIVGCDGAHSGLRRGLNVPRRFQRTDGWFAMANFSADPLPSTEAHLFFTAHGSVEAFPLPGAVRRWVVPATGPTMTEATLRRRVAAVSGIRLGGTLQGEVACFQIRQALSPYIWRRPPASWVVGCGDAVHAISPIGGQGLNTGFADAQYLAAALGCGTSSRRDAALASYARLRRTAAVQAMRRAALSQWVGTRGGRVLSALRGAALRCLQGTPGSASVLARHFSMLSIRGCTLVRAGVSLAPDN